MVGWAADDMRFICSDSEYDERQACNVFMFDIDAYL